MLKKFHMNLKINRKLFLILILEAFVFGALGMGALQISFYIYDMQLYDNVERVLNMYSVNIENKLNEVENLSYNILKDKEIQRNLEIVKADGATYTRFVAANDINNELMSWHNSISKPVLSIQIFDGNNFEYSSKTKAYKMPDDRRNELVAKARENSGSNVWVEPSYNDDAIVMTRTIREISNLSLSSLGTLVIRVDPRELINLYEEYLPEYNSNIYIISPREIIFGEDDDFDLPKVLSMIKKDKGYFITDINNDKELVTYRKAKSTDWVFVNTVPYESIYEKITVVRIAMFLAYLLVLLALMFLGFKFARSITKPIEKLTNEMKIIESGDFGNLGGLHQNKADEIVRKDEIGRLQHDFYLMISEIDSLIRENYVKQLQVKEFEYKALQAQINPHFLYNTLDSINWLAKVNSQQQIAVMVKSLGDLLRSSISRKEPVIPLKDEIKILEDYITIQKIRYQERLEISVNIGEELRDRMITKFTLQPIVENSINYGLEKNPSICKIFVKGRLLADKAEIVISDNGSGIGKDTLEALRRGEIQSRGSGIGLKNINDRLKLVFGLQYGLEIDSVEEEGTTVSIFIPL